MACPHQATKLPKTATIVAGNGNKLLPFSATLLPGVDRPLHYALWLNDASYCQLVIAQCHAASARRSLRLVNFGVEV